MAAEDDLFVNENAQAIDLFLAGASKPEERVPLGESVVNNASFVSWMSKKRTAATDQGRHEEMAALAPAEYIDPSRRVRRQQQQAFTRTSNIITADSVSRTPSPSKPMRSLRADT